MVATGVLAEGARLPAIRQLSKDLRLASGTVARAYRELEAEGLIATRGRNGTFVNHGSESIETPAADELLAEAAMAFAVHARQLGADAARALRVAQDALKSVETHTRRVTREIRPRTTHQQIMAPIDRCMN